MSRKKVWWLVTWDAPTFEGSSGRLVYTEAVKARHPQIAASKALRRFKVKLDLVMRNGNKILGGRETQVQLMSGRVMHANHWVGNYTNHLLGEYLQEASQPYFDGYSDAATALDRLGLSAEPVAPIFGLIKRLEQSACSHSNTDISYRKIGVVTNEIEWCRDCSFRRLVGRHVTLKQHPV